MLITIRIKYNSIIDLYLEQSKFGSPNEAVIFCTFNTSPLRSKFWLSSGRERKDRSKTEVRDCLLRAGPSFQHSSLSEILYQPNIHYARYPEDSKSTTPAPTMCLRVYFKYTKCDHSEQSQERYYKFKSECDDEKRVAKKNAAEKKDDEKKLRELIELRCLNRELLSPLPTFHQKEAAKGLKIFQRIRRHCKETPVEGQYRLDTDDAHVFLDLQYDYVDSAHAVQKLLTASLRTYKCIRGRKSTDKAIPLIYKMRIAIQWTVVDYLIEKPEANVPSDTVRRRKEDLAWTRPYPPAGHSA